MRHVPRLHVVTDDGVLARGGIGEVMKVVLEAGGADVALHVRGPRTDGGRIFEVVKRVQPTAAAVGGRLFVNDRADVALAAGADGIHLGQRSLPVGVVRRLLGEDVAIGASVHGGEEACIAEKEGADYLFVGTLFATPSHERHDPEGPALIASIRSTMRGLPLVGIGGITTERVASVVDAGATGVAVVRGIWDAESPADAVGAYLSALDVSKET